MDELLKTILGVIVAIIPVMGVGYSILMRDVTMKLKEYAEENSKLRSQNGELRDALYEERNNNDEIKRQVNNLNDIVQTLQSQVNEFESKYKDEITLRKFFEEQADKNNQMVIEERERRIVAETRLEAKEIRIQELKALLEGRKPDES